MRNYKTLSRLFVFAAVMFMVGTLTIRKDKIMQMFASANTATATSTATPTPTATATAVPICACQQGGVSTGGVAIANAWTACSVDFRGACQVTLPPGSLTKHLEFQNQCSDTVYIQTGGVTAAVNQGYQIFTSTAPGVDKVYDVTNSPAAIAPPGSSTGINLIPPGPLSLISAVGSCSLNFNILVR